MSVWEIKEGETFTIEGCYRVIENPKYRWWKLWTDPLVETDELQVFTVTGTATADRIERDGE
jgi:hypothetical protein